MRTIAAVLIVFAIAVAGTMIGLSGFAEAWGAEAPDTVGPQEELESAADEANTSGTPIEGPITFGEGNIVGLIANGLGSVVSFAGAVALLPVTLMNLVFPYWFAVPMGMIAYLLAGIGVIQFATDRRWV